MTAPSVFSNYINSMAAAYEKNMASTSVQAINKAVSEILSPIITDSYILDNACSPGVVTREIKRLYPDAHIVAADSFPAMLARVRDLTIQTPWENVEVKQLDMRYLKVLKDNSFTRTFTNFGIAVMGEDAEGPLKAVRELHRVLKLGGVCVVIIWAGL
jgi:ubiquinone/menaquinone biosynthesis C-methylase UbiE